MISVRQNLMTQSLSKPILSNSMEAKKTSILLQQSNSETSNGIYRSAQKSHTGLNDKLKKSSVSNGDRRNFRGRNNGGDEFIMLQRPTILAKPPAPTLAILKDQDKEINQDTGVRTKTLIQQQKVRSATPEKISLNNNKVLDENYIFSNNNNKVSLAKCVENKFQKTIPTTKRDFLTPLVNNQKENFFHQQQPTPPVTLTGPPPIMQNTTKILDENLQWSDTLQEYLIEQTDFLVIGVLGKKGVGKSTLMSLLASNSASDLFTCQSKDLIEQGQHKTSGIQAFVTKERTILLDVQPLLSSSSLEKSINTDKKNISNDFKYYENYIELQSIELACFILSVCNVVLLTEDWFIDPNLFRILHTAEMLMPTLSSIGTANSSSSDEVFLDHHAHLVYVLNKSGFNNKLDTFKMKTTIDNLMKDSKLSYKNSINELSWFATQKNRGNKQNTENIDSVNFVVMPKLKPKNGLDSESFNGLPSVETSAKWLTRELLGVTRNLNSNVTEKRWFSYANKIWDAIRKSQLINEYNRLMT